MPELPEVEALAHALAEKAVGHTVTRLDVVAVSVLKTYDPPARSLGGLIVDGVTRRGKFLDIGVGGGPDGAGLRLVLHLARAGWLRWRDELPPAPPRPGKGPLALRVHLDAGGFDVTEAGTQKRLAAYIVRDPAEVPGVARLGPDPLGPSFTTAALARLLKDKRERLKGVLRDQSVIAGIGNAYSDEILHVARFSPYKLAAGLSAAEVEELHAAIVGTLGQAVERAKGLEDGSIKDDKRTALRVHGRTGQACPVCGDTIREVSFADSSLQYCPTCQTGGRRLADRRLSRLLR